MTRERENMLRKTERRKREGGRGGETMESRPRQLDQRNQKDPVKGGPPPPPLTPINENQMDLNTGSQISVLI